MAAGPLLGLTACQTVESPRHPIIGMAKETPPAGFRLAAQRVVWQSQPALPLKYNVSKQDNDSTRRYFEADTKAYFRALVEQMGKDVAPLLQAKLKAANALGDEHFVLLTPTLGENFSASMGAGSVRLTVRVEVMARDARVLWSEELRFNQTNNILFDRSLPKPSANASPDLVSGVILAFREVGLIT